MKPDTDNKFTATLTGENMEEIKERIEKIIWPKNFNPTSDNIVFGLIGLFEQEKMKWLRKIAPCNRDEKFGDCDPYYMDGWNDYFNKLFSNAEKSLEGGEK